MAYVIGLDAGHYVGDGRVSKAYRAKLGTNDEYTLNLRTWNKVKTALEGNGFKVVDIGNQYRSVVDRAKLAKALGCDIVISLHHNAGGGTGISIFIHANGVMGAKSAELQKTLYKYLEQVNKGNRSKPLRNAILGVINCSTTKCPSVLIECAFMDNDIDVAKINSPTFNDQIASAILKGVCEYFGVAVKTNSSASTSKESATIKKKYNPWAYAKVQKVPAGDVLNVRSGPSVNNGIVKTLGNGNEVDVIQTYTNGWAKINIVGTIGYVNAYYLKITEVVAKEPTYATWVGKAYNLGKSTLNVRTGPGTSYKNLAAWPKLAEGNLVEVIGESGNWYKVRIAHMHVGYVSKDYIKRA